MEGLSVVLSLADTVLDGFPFPGAKLVIKGVLKCVDNAKVDLLYTPSKTQTRILKLQLADFVLKQGNSEETD